MDPKITFAIVIVISVAVTASAMYAVIPSQNNAVAPPTTVQDTLVADEVADEVAVIDHASNFKRITSQEDLVRILKESYALDRYFNLAHQYLTNVTSV